MINNPNGMTREELVKTIRDLSRITVERAILNFKEEWELDDEILEDIEFGNYVKDTSKVQHKSYKTKFIKMYQSEVTKLLDDKKLTHEDLGILTHLATFTGFEDNTLRMPDGEYMTLKDMQKILAIGKTKMAELLKKYRELDLIIQGKQPVDKRKSRFILNPDLFYKGKMIKKNTKEYFINIKKQKKEQQSKQSDT